MGGGLCRTRDSTPTCLPQRPPHVKAAPGSTHITRLRPGGRSLAGRPAQDLLRGPRLVRGLDIEDRAGLGDPLLPGLLPGAQPCGPSRPGGPRAASPLPCRPPRSPAAAPPAPPRPAGTGRTPARPGGFGQDLLQLLLTDAD